MSPQNSLLIVPGRKKQKVTSINMDSTIRSSKDFFEPDEISIESAPYEIGREIVIDLHNEDMNTRKARNTA